MLVSKPSTTLYSVNFKVKHGSTPRFTEDQNRQKYHRESKWDGDENIQFGSYYYCQYLVILEKLADF